MPLSVDQSRDLANAFQSGGGDAVPIAKSVLQTLKPENNLLLCAVVQLFDMIVKQSKRNQMTASNLGIAIGPTLFNGIGQNLYGNAMEGLVTYWRSLWSVDDTSIFV